MNISEEQLKELVLRVLSDLEAEKRAECMKDSKQTLYMLCVSPWSERYMEFLKKMEGSDAYDIVPVIPPSWKNMGYEARLRQSVSFGKILYRSGEMPDNLDRAVTLLPVVPRDVLVKTALCISDTYETSWIAECMKQGSRAWKNFPETKNPHTGNVSWSITDRCWNLESRYAAQRSFRAESLMKYRVKGRTGQWPAGQKTAHVHWSRIKRKKE